MVRASRWKLEFHVEEAGDFALSFLPVVSLSSITCLPEACYRSLPLLSTSIPANINAADSSLPTSSELHLLLISVLLRHPRCSHPSCPPLQPSASSYPMSAIHAPFPRTTSSISISSCGHLDHISAASCRQPLNYPLIQTHFGIYASSPIADNRLALLPDSSAHHNLPKYIDVSVQSSRPSLC